MTQALRHLCVAFHVAEDESKPMHTDISHELVYPHSKP